MKKCWKLILFTILILIALEGFSTTLYKQVDFLMSGFRTANDEFLEGGKVYVYESGGMLTPETMYQDRLGNTPHTNPIVLDSYGRAEVYGNGVYRFVIKTSEDVSIETIDGYECYSNSSDATTSLNEQVDEIQDVVDAIPTTYLKLDTSNDPLSDDLDLNSNNIINVADPTLAQHSSTKNYADNNVGGVTLTDEAIADGDILVYQNSSNTFEKKAISTVIGNDGPSPLILIDQGNYTTTYHVGTQDVSVTHAGYTTYYAIQGYTTDTAWNISTASSTTSWDCYITTSGTLTWSFTNSAVSSAWRGTIYWIAISIKD